MHTTSSKRTTVFLYFLLLLLPTFSISAQGKWTRYVNPFIGTTNYGATNPGAVCPSGMMSVCPFNVMGSELNSKDKDKCWWSMPYLKENVYLTGFSHSNLSGVGCPDLGALLTMATMGKRKVDYREYGSNFGHEVAEPGYYATTLERYGIRAEMTATLRSSRERYTFPKGEGHLLLNLGEGLTNESGAYVKRINAREYVGYKLLGTFCYAEQAVFPIYFCLRVNLTPKASGYWKKQRPMQAESAWDRYAGQYKCYTKYGREMAGNDIGVWMDFDTRQGQQIELSMGISFVSIENARENLDSEQQGLSFTQIRQAATAMWERELGKIEVEGGSLEDKTIFYSALYHVLLHPNLLQDCNGEYPKMESDSIGRCNYNRYTVMSLWDTYRNVSQLLTLVYPEKQNDILRSMTDIYKEQGWMPKWELYGRETYTMDGDPAAAYIADAYLRGMRGFDTQKAYEGLRKSATDTCPENRLRPCLHDLERYGYVPLRKINDVSVSECLENCTADYALAKMAKQLGHPKDARRFAKRALAYRNYYRKSAGALCPKWSNGKFYDPFNPQQGEHFSEAPGFHEGSSWNYTFSAGHDIDGMVRLMGGEKAYVGALEKVLEKGWYDPTNEPDIIYPYLFSHFPSEARRTQYWTRKLLRKYYNTQPWGIPGNDDTGTLSAWGIFTMMGIYPDTPGNPAYYLTAPVFKKITLHLDPRYYQQEKVIICSDGDSKLRPRASYRISHKDLVHSPLLELY